MIGWLLTLHLAVGWLGSAAAAGRGASGGGFGGGGSSGSGELHNEVLMLANDTDRFLAADIVVANGPFAVECRAVKDQFGRRPLSPIPWSVMLRGSHGT
jgi:hypothetical protein